MLYSNKTIKNISSESFKNTELKELEAQKVAYSTYVQKYNTKHRRVPKNLKTFPTEYLRLSEHKSLKKSAHWITDYKVERRNHNVESKFNFAFSDE